MQSLKSKGSVSEGSPAGQEAVWRKEVWKETAQRQRCWHILMGFGSCFHTFSVWKNEWKQENWREEKKERKKQGQVYLF